VIEKDRVNDVMLGFVDTGYVATCFFASVLDAYAADAGRPTRRLIEYFNGPGPYIHDNRARVARYFLECTNKQWLWMLDTDIQFASNSLYRLLDAAEEHDCKLLGAAYWNTYPGRGRYLSWLVLMPGKGFVAAPEFPVNRSVPAEVHAVGMGCTLIHRSVLEDVREMYPNDPWDTFGADILYQFVDGGMYIVRSPDDLDEDLVKDRVFAPDYPLRLGEDVTFCMRARKAGHVCYGLPSLEVEHFKPHFLAHGRADATSTTSLAHGRQDGNGLSGDAAARPDHKEDLARAAL
jgi:hypothetical protein